VIHKEADVDESALIINSSIGKKCWVARNSRFCYSTLGDYSYISENSHVFSSFIGKYTSISWNVSIGPANHDYKRITQHSMLFSNRFGMIDSTKPHAYNQYEGKVEIGNDVWIGCGSCITRGVTIGDGAVIGAGAFVSKDIPPYAIVINANQIIGYRFSKDVIAAFLDFKWWDYPDDIIKKNINEFAKDNVSVNDILKLKKMMGEQNDE